MADQDQDVIHKIVVKLVDGPQAFRVPRTAVLVSVGPDPWGQGLAVWFRFTPSHPSYTGPGFETEWRLQVVGTGHPFPPEARVLGTVVQSMFAWHLLDLDRAVRG